MKIRVRKDLREKGFRPETSVGWLPRELMESVFEVDVEGFIRAKRLEKDICIRGTQHEFWVNVQDFEPVLAERREGASHGRRRGRVIGGHPILLLFQSSTN